MQCLSTKPQVINHVLINKCLEEQCFKGEAGRLAKMEGIPWDVVTEITLEFKYILRIDHLWVLPALTKLNLNNNYIELIENLDSLVNLVELNLSFNKISALTNLDKLVNLETLLLYENMISRIENISHLKKLTIFNIGKNRITDREQVLRLRLHNNLKSLNMQGNPCAEKDNFRIYVAVFLPQLHYYCYKMIDDHERSFGRVQFEGSLHRITNDEAIECAARLKLEQEQAEAEQHVESFVEFLNSNHLFQQMFEQDPEGVDLLSMGGEAKECYGEYRDKLLEITLQIFETGQEQYHLRKKEVESYLKCVNDAKCANQKKSIAEMENFTTRKNKYMAKVTQMQDDLINRDINMEDYVRKVNEYELKLNLTTVPKVWKTLMGLELTLYEQLEEVNETFEQTLKDMVAQFIETAQGGFTQIRMLESTYLDNITSLAIIYMTNFHTREHFIGDEKMLTYITDKDTLLNALNASHDVHMQVIDNREDRLIDRARTWLHNLVQNLQKDEITRNRAKILEINHFLDINLEQFMQFSQIDIFKRHASEEYLDQHSIY